MVSVLINGRFSLATIDEGSEVNCMDEGFAIRSNINFVPTICTATAAGSTTMKLVGQTKENVIMVVQGTIRPVVWNLGNMVVVRHLGTSILIGEPGKKDNKIVTIPHNKVIELHCDAGNKMVLPYAPKNHPQIQSSATCKAVQSETIYPDQAITVELPMVFKSEECVAISRRRETPQPWIVGKVVPVNVDGTVTE